MLASKVMQAVSGGVEKLFSDDVFTSWVRTGTGADVTITTGIDMTQGYMLWTKGRSGATDHALYHSARGVTLDLATNTTAAQTTQTTGLKSVSSTGHTIGSLAKMNTSSSTYVDWVVRNADKFYNHAVVTKTAGSNATVSFANLGTLGMVRVKRTDSTGSWYIWHRSLSAGQLLIGETTAAAATLGHVTVSGTTVTLVNGVIADGTYLVEGFAHDTGTDGIIQCGSFVATGNDTITLGWESQYVLMKRASTTSGWLISDVSRGASNSNTQTLDANTSAADVAYADGLVVPIATGFKQSFFGSGDTVIYLAIRRPNKPPTSGTEVYNGITSTLASSGNLDVTNTFPIDTALVTLRTGTLGAFNGTRLVGSKYLNASNINDEGTGSPLFNDDGNQNSIRWPGAASGTYINHLFRRAPGVYDQICYNGSGSNKTEAHNLTKAPELWMAKRRNSTGSWTIGSSLLNANEKIVMPSPNGRATDATAWNSTYPTATALSLGTLADVNASGGTYVAYLWASTAGVSKVFTYTGNGTSQTIDCGFTTGARFVMIIRVTASTAQDIYVWDSARGITSGNDPRLSLNTTAAEVTTLDTIDPASSGFIVNQDASNINVNGAVYIGLAYA